MVEDGRVLSYILQTIIWLCIVVCDHSRRSIVISSYGTFSSKSSCSNDTTERIGIEIIENIGIESLFGALEPVIIKVVLFYHRRFSGCDIISYIS